MGLYTYAFSTNARFYGRNFNWLQEPSSFRNGLFIISAFLPVALSGHRSWQWINYGLFTELRTLNLKWMRRAFMRIFIGAFLLNGHATFLSNYRASASSIQTNPMSGKIVFSLTISLSRCLCVSVTYFQFWIRSVYLTNQFIAIQWFC